MHDNLLPLETVMARVHLGRTKIYALIADGEFPSPTKIGSASRWSERQIDAWIAARFPTGDAPAGAANAC